MVTRRQVLAGTLGLPLALHAGSPALSSPPEGPVRILAEFDYLSEESAVGFEMLLHSNRHVCVDGAGLIIVPASRRLASGQALQLRGLVWAGSWLLLESGLCFSRQREWAEQERLLRNVFGLSMSPPVPVSGHEWSGRYIAYSWPVHRLVRTFAGVIPVSAPRAECCARLNGMPVAIRRAIGNGGIIFLGSMLGPGLRAQEAEAHQLGAAILRSVFNGPA